MDRKQLTQLWREVQRTSSYSGRVVFRTTSGISPIENDLPLDLQTHWRTDELTNEKFLNRDRSSVYGGFHLYEKKLQPSNSLGISQDQSFEPALVFTGN
jgi:S-adenosylmethionine-diacylglycerol 3-amino-3-carboxypropyl transferase